MFGFHLNSIKRPNAERTTMVFSLPVIKKRRGYDIDTDSFQSGLAYLVMAILFKGNPFPPPYAGKRIIFGWEFIKGMSHDCNEVVEADLTLQGEVESQNIRDVTEGKKNTYINQLSEALDELIHANEDEIDDYTRINEVCLKGKILSPDYKEKPI